MATRPTIFSLFILFTLSLFPILAAQPAHADELPALVDALAEGGFNQRAQAIDALAATGDARVVPALEALGEGDLYERKADSKVVIAKRSGSVYVVTDPVTGENLGDLAKGALKKVKVNNRLRRSVRDALGGLQLRSKNPTDRLAAADKVFKSKDPEAIPLLDAAIAAEEDAAVKTAMLEARAVAVLASDLDDTAKTGAISVLKARSDRDARSILLAFLVAGAVGVAIERGIIRWLYGRPLETLLATWGISLALQQTVRSIFGPTNKEVGNPDFMSGAFEIGQMTITYNRLYILVFAMVVLAALMLVMKKTPYGLQMRAVTQNRTMAGAMGIRTDWVDALTFGLGSGIAGIAGVALSQIDNVSPNLGQSYIIDSFMVVVFGGVGNLWGTLVGAMTLGVANKFLEPFAGAVLGKIVVLVFIILFIQKKPRGMFALKGRAVEA